MFSVLFCGLLLLIHTLPSTGIRHSPLWPQPVKADLGQECLWIDRSMTAVIHCGSAVDSKPSFRISSTRTFADYAESLKQRVLDGAQVVRRSILRASEILPETHHSNTISEQDIERETVRQAMIDIHGTKFVPWKFHKRHTEFEPSPSHQQRLLTSLTIEQQLCPVRLIDPLSFHGGNEDYEVEIHTDGKALIKSTSSLGTMRALGMF